MLKFRSFNSHIVEYFGGDIQKAIRYKGKIHLLHEPFGQHMDIIDQMTNDKVLPKDHNKVDRIIHSNELEFGYFHVKKQTFAQYVSEL